jgi:DNA-binding HxlR family transcriptional regulator
MDLLGKRWTCLIVRSMVDGPRRFSEISSYVVGVSDRVLSERLQELEQRGIVERRVLDQRPVRVEYALSESGLQLRDVLHAIKAWADRWTVAEKTPAGVS